jgi:hypothetical protein
MKYDCDKLIGKDVKKTTFIRTASFFFTMKIKCKYKTQVLISEPNLAFLSYPITDLEGPLGLQ